MKIHYKFNNNPVYSPCYYVKENPYPEILNITDKKEKVTCKTCVKLLKNIEDNIRLWFINIYNDDRMEERALLFNLLIGAGL